MTDADKLSKMPYDELIRRLQGGAMIGSEIYNETTAELKRRDYNQHERSIAVNERLTNINKWNAIAMGVLTAVLIAVTVYDVFVKL